MSYFPLNLQRAINVFARFEYAGTHINRFSYVADSDITTSGQLSDFLSVFKTNVIAVIRSLQVDALVWLAYNVSTLQAGGPYVEDFDPALGGVVGVQGMPAYVVYTFRLLRSTSGVRGGFKRFSGVPETYTAFGEYTAGSPPPANVNAVRNALTAPIAAGGVTYTPAVFISTFNGQPLPVPHYYVPPGAEFRLRPGTQLTRKR